MAKANITQMSSPRGSWSDSIMIISIVVLLLISASTLVAAIALFYRYAAT